MIVGSEMNLGGSFMIILRNVFFVLLFSIVYIPLLGIIERLFRMDFGTSKKVIGAMLMGVSFFILKHTLALDILRLLMQFLLFYIILVVLMGRNYVKALYALLTYGLISFVTETAIMSLFNNTSIGVEQLISIDSFYGLMIVFNAVVLFSIYLIVRMFTKPAMHYDVTEKTETV